MGGGGNQLFQTFNSDWLATVRGRLGYAYDRVLFYGTGGLAVANVSVSDSVGIPLSSTSSSSQTKTGWTAGGGIELAVAPSWSVKAEYLYVDLGTVTTGALLGGAIAPNPATAIRHKITEDVGRLGINYRF